MKLSEVIHLYIGQECRAEPEIEADSNQKPYVGKICRVDIDKNGIRTIIVNDEKPYGNAIEFIGGDSINSELKAILRPVSSITREDIVAIASITDPGHNVSEIEIISAQNEMTERGMDALVLSNVHPRVVFQVTALLLSLGFDLFGLIESGEALDKTSLTP